MCAGLECVAMPLPARAWEALALAAGAWGAAVTAQQEPDCPSDCFPRGRAGAQRRHGYKTWQVRVAKRCLARRKHH